MEPESGDWDLEGLFMLLGLLAFVGCWLWWMA